MGKKSKSKAVSSTKKRSSSGSVGSGRQKKKAVDPFGTNFKSTTSVNQSIFHTYKLATQQFKEELSNLVPPSIFEHDLVQNFVDAVDYVQNNKLSVTDVLLKNLRTAISVRKKYATRIYGGDDEGHAYFILVLNYCLQVLKTCNRTFIKDIAVKVENHDQEKAVEISNRFDALTLFDEDLTGESDDESDEDDKPISRPKTPEKSYSFNDLNSFSSKAKCLHLFDTLELHAHRMKLVFQNVKESLRMDAEGKLHHSILKEFIFAGAYATSSMLEVQKAEKLLHVECPDLGESPYRILAVSFMSIFINMLTEIVRKHSPLGRKYKDIHSIAFVGDIIECAFKCQLKGWQTISDKFARRWKLSDHWKMKNALVAEKIFKVTMKCSMCKVEEQYGNIKQWVQNGLGEISNIPIWLEAGHDGKFNWTTINEDQSILNTMKLLDILATNTKENADSHVINLFTKILCEARWDEDTQPAKKIRGDLDTVVCSMHWSIMQSKWRFDGGRMPHEEVMLPLVSMIRQWTASEMKAPSFALTFGIHLVLMSLFAIQGNGDVANCARISEVAFNKFYHQVEAQLSSEVPRSSNREHCLKFVLDTKRVSQLLESVHDIEQITHAHGHNLLVWNPLSAMCLLSYQSTYLNLEAGFAILNDSSVVTTVLHMYNALKVRELIDKHETIPLLTELDTQFSGLKVFWNGWEEKPKQGKFIYRFFLSAGFSHETASWFQNRARHFYGGGPEPGKRPKETLEKFLYNQNNSQRVSVKADPADVSEYFKIACREEYSTNNPYEWGLKLQSEMNGILKCNMLVVGQKFHEFLFNLLSPDTNLNVKKFLKEIPADNPGQARGALNIHMASELLGALDYIEDIDEYNYLAMNLIEFFGNLDMDGVSMISN